MKKIILTSSFGTNKKVDGKRYPCEMNNANNYVDILKSLLVTQDRLVLVSSNPNEYVINDDVRNVTEKSFNMSGFNFKEVIMLDKRNANDTENIIKNSDVVMLCGGHVPTQNNWFKEINLKQILSNYNGLIIGGSAGSMNCAKTVYCPPELEGEAINPNFNKWIDGLGLTDINIFPHYSDLLDEEIDGFKMIDDIVLKDSFQSPIYTLNDGSFIKIADEEIIIYGECYKIHNGIITLFCEDDKTVRLI